MKTKTTKVEAASPQAKGKVKLKTLKLHKETLQNLSDQDAGAVRGGVDRTRACTYSGCGYTGCGCGGTVGCSGT